MNAYCAAAERREAEQAIRLMGAVTLGYGGTRQERKDFANALLGLGDERLDSAEINKLLGGISSSDDPEQAELKEWAREQFREIEKTNPKIFDVN